MEIKSKILELLGSLSANEIKKLEDFLNSPYHNKNQKALKLFCILKEFHPHFNSEQLTKEIIYGRLYADSAFEEWKVRNVLSDLYILTEEFLAYQNFGKDKLTSEKILIEELISRKLFKAARKRMLVLESEGRKIPTNCGDHFKNKFEFEELKGFIYYSDHGEPDTNISISTVEYMRIHFLIIYLKSMGNIIDAEWLTGKLSHNDKFLNSILYYLKENSESEHPYLQTCYYLIMSNMEENNMEYYFRLKLVLEQNYTEFKKEEMFYFYLYLHNYIMKKIRNGDITLYKELFGLFNWILEHHIIEYQEYFLHTYFNNFVNSGLANNEIEWTVNFIENYKYRLRDELRETVVHYSQSKIFLKKKEYDKALDSLSKTQPLNDYYKINTRIYYIIVYYDMGNPESALDMSENLKKYIKTVKFHSSKFKVPYVNFIKYFQKLFKMSYSNDIEAIHFLQKDIINNPEVKQREWLLQKLNVLLDI